MESSSRPEPDDDAKGQNAQDQSDPMESVWKKVGDKILVVKFYNNSCTEADMKKWQELETKYPEYLFQSINIDHLKSFQHGEQDDCILGMALFKDKEMIGLLDEEEMERLIRDINSQ